MRQFSVQRMTHEPNEFGLNANPMRVELSHLMMLAVERALAPPIVHRRSTFQPMRIIVASPELRAELSTRDDWTTQMPKVLPRALPPAGNGANTDRSQLRHRSVRGEILSDGNGKLYEKVGREIRPINQLASGPYGEVVDVVSVPPPSQGDILPPEGARAANNSEATDRKIKTPVDGAFPKFATAADQSPTQPPPQISHRKLFADPGQWRVVRWGEFKQILSKQLVHPERLRDTYRLPCYVQVIETERPVAIGELAAVHKLDSKVPGSFYFLTDEIASKLDLILPLRPAPPRNAPRAPNTLLAHERVFRLVVANDPTTDVSRINLQPAVKQTKPVDSNEPVAESRPTILKTSVPTRFMKESAFRFSRDEVLYDMKAKSSVGTAMRDLCSRLRFVTLRKEFRKWQTLLEGKAADEQLWDVRPPVTVSADSRVRIWAEKMLEENGYDAPKMIREWEIFWRRKGF